MKDPKEYLGKINLFTTRKELYSIGKQMQIDAYNEALKDVINNVRLNYSDCMIGCCPECGVDGADEQSILELKK